MGKCYTVSSCPTSAQKHPLLIFVSLSSLYVIQTRISLAVDKFILESDARLLTVVHVDIILEEIFGTLFRLYKLCRQLNILI